MTFAPDCETTLERDGLDFHVEHFRAQADVRLSVIFVHGFSAHCALYRHVGRALSAKGVAVTTFDGRGHGRSGGQRGHVQEFADYLDDLAMIVEWARSQNPDLPWALVGHSLGGAIVASYTLDERRTQPDRAVLAAPYFKLKMKVPAPKRMAANVVAKVATTFSMPNGLVGKNISRNLTAVAGFDADPLIFHLASVGWFMATLRAQAHLRTHAQELKVPTLMLLAGDDRIVANEASLAFAQHAGGAVTVKTYEGLFHELFFEPEAATVIGDICGWLLAESVQRR